MAAYCPIVHIKNGTLGIHGHVCSFPQDISNICNVLPRLPSDVKVVRMIRNYKNNMGDIVSKTYLIRRFYVIRALKWLIKYHEEYRNAFECGELQINEDHLSWMGEKESADLCGVMEFETSLDEAQFDSDRGPAEKQCLDPIEDGNEEFESSGVVSSNVSCGTNKKNDDILQALKKSAESSGCTRPAMDWPQVSTDAASEYSDAKIFVNAFPWLFPGGIGDYIECRPTQIKLKDWVRNLLYYKDGRFQRDKVWCFYTLNYFHRHKNQGSGAFFVKSFVKDAPKTLQELQNQLKNGDDGFISKMTYYSHKVFGSDAYWRFKKSELYTWIHHHIEHGNGAPSLFITLSCAEYFWPDLMRLLEERIFEAEGRQVDLQNNKTERNRAINDYSLVVQEFFQIRTKDFLEHIGQEIFGIKYYWVRYEFAKGRGQIHAHLLAITDEQKNDSISKRLYDLRTDKNAQAALLAEWAQDKFGLTAMHPSTNIEGTIPRDQIPPPEGIARISTEPCSLRLCQVSNFHQDTIDLFNVAQMHKCSDYCMRRNRSRNKNKSNDEKEKDGEETKM